MSKPEATQMPEASDRALDLFGEFRFKVDDKGRVALPAKWRKALSKNLIVSRELADDCIYVFEVDSFNDWVEQIFEDSFNGFDAANKAQVRFRTKLKSRADEVERDSSGRIMLKPEIREAVGIDREVVLVGNTGYFEIWDAKAYDEAMDDIDLSAIYKS